MVVPLSIEFALWKFSISSVTTEDLRGYVLFIEWIEICNTQS